MENTNRTTKGVASAAILFGLLALFVRLTYIVELRSCPFFDSPIIDASTYVSQATAIAKGDIWGQGSVFDFGKAYWQPPGYPIFLSIFIYLFGLDYFILHAVGAFVGALTVALTVALAARVFGRKTAYVAGAVGAFFGPMIFFDGELLVASSFTFFVTILLLSAIWARDSLRRWFVVGAILGVAAVFLPTVLTTAPLFILWMGTKVGFKRRLLKIAAITALGIIIPIAPVTIRNAVVGREFVSISTNAGLNFYIGNHPTDSIELQRIRPGRDWKALTRLSELAGETSESGKSGWYFRESLKLVAANPVEWIALKLKAAATLMNGHEVMRNQDPYFLRRYSRVLSALLWEEFVSFPTGIILPLAVIGLIAATKYGNGERDGKAALLLAAFFVWYGAQTVMFFVTSRYRAPVMPIAICFAAFGATRIADRIKNKNWKSLGGYGAIFSVALVFCNLPFFRTNLYVDGENEYSLARTFYAQNKYDAAKPLYLVSLEKNPNNAVAMNEMGAIAIRQNNPTEALAWFDKALKLDPLYEEAHNNRGVALVKLRRYPEAAEEFQKAIELSPEWELPRRSLEKLKEK